MRYLMVAVVLVMAGQGVAQAGPFLSIDGSVFRLEQNRHGAVLTSIVPDAESVFANSTPNFAPGDLLYLGRSCDAFARRFGDGTWNTTEAGVLVEFGDIRVAFPGQQMNITSDDRCQM